MPQIIILKADDIRRDPEHILSPRWQKFITYIIDQNIQASLGLIGNSLEGEHPAYFDRLKEIHNSPHFELWHHGYDHVLNATNDRGETYCEFSNTPFEHQLDHLHRTQDLAQEKLDITFHTFGAPGNKIDDTTCVAIDQIDDLEVWFYGHPQSQKYLLKRSINMEHPTHNPDFAAFKTQYNPQIECLTLQGHPNSWDDQRFHQFDLIIQFLKQQGCTFALPYAYCSKAR
jgi:peptidoglycan/xylan/chitin deacetylase (PgdA/CDA1 family)